MKAYTYRIGKRSGDELTTVAFSQEVHADSLGEAIDMVKAMTRKRIVTDVEDTVQIFDEEQPGQQAIWTRSAEEIRNG